LRIARDITCSADQILITAGFQGALGLVIQALLKPGAKVLVEDPGYVFARNLLQQARLRLVGVRIDDGGFDVAAAMRSAPDAALALVTPSHQYPLGMTLPVERRLALLDWADRERTWIVEDDYDCEFHHRGLPPPALKSLDRGGRVLYAGSFSKVLFPGLRLGYVVLPSLVAERFARVVSAALPTPPITVQKSVEIFMSQGYFARHLSRMRTLYTERRKALAATIESTMRRYVEVRLQDGGMHFGVRHTPDAGRNARASMIRYFEVRPPQTVDTFLADPQKLVPANRMPYAGMSDAGDRTDLIAYLQKATK
jgi:GntR family transcriptional regulator/MocR family aminotransferase